MVEMRVACSSSESYNNGKCVSTCSCVVLCSINHVLSAVTATLITECKNLLGSIKDCPTRPNQL